MKKVIIFYASYGGGHLSAGKSIKEYIDSNFPDIQTELIDCINYISKSIDKITTSAYKCMAKNAPKLWGNIYNNSQKGILSKVSNSTNRYLASKLYHLFEEKKPDIIISTHPFGSQMTSYLKKIGKVNCILASILTDFAPHDQWLVGNEFIDYFFVAHDKMKYSLVDTGIPESKIFATGIPVSSRFLKKYNKNEVFNLFKLNPNKKVILFFGGGEFGLGKDRTISIFKFLSKNTQKYQIVAISGRNKKMKSSFETLITDENKNDIKIFEYTNNVPELMHISSLVITKPGGLTSSESLASGLPIIVINPLPGQEEENASFLENNHVAIWIKNGDNIEEEISSILDFPNTLENLQKQARLLGKPNSTKDICEIILNTNNC